MFADQLQLCIVVVLSVERKTENKVEECCIIESRLDVCPHDA